jgi:cytochrome c oxidase subunit 1
MNDLMITVFFILMFIGVNTTFFPLHFSGLQGYPRKYMDYADAYSLWNIISSLGAILRVFAIFFFFYILYRRLVGYSLVLVDTKPVSSPESSFSNYVFIHSYQCRICFTISP